MSMNATAKLSGGGLRSEVGVNGRHAIVTDEPERLGGTEAGPAPHELLPAAVAGCVATVIAMYARTKGWDLGELRVDVDYDNEAIPRRMRIDVYLPESLTAEQRQRLEQVAKTCPVRRALETGFAFEERLIMEPAPPNGRVRELQRSD
jgi:putative redox protein